MKLIIKTIEPGGLSGNCYLIETQKGFILIVTGEKTNYEQLEKELNLRGCISFNLNLIIFTHNNSNNNNTYSLMREKYKSKIALHILDKELINEPEPFNFWNSILKSFKNTFFTNSKKTNFKPDLIIDEGSNLSEFGLNARVLYLPGHSNSVGVLTENGELFLDDLINEEGLLPGSQNHNVNYLKKLKNLFVDIVYPSHGDPILLQSLNL
ncbi:MAG TPA: hypothetical protein DCG75_15975 [Bacteroidales bacterium]|nr:hypothetical protein [Bacteroidales bacterium]